MTNKHNDLEDRRSFLKTGAALTGAALGTGIGPNAVVAAPKLVNPASIRQFVNLLPNPLDPAALAKRDVAGGASYTLTIREVMQDLGIAPGAQTKTRVWGYGSAGQTSTFPGPTFEVQQGSSISVTYVNSLRDAAGRPLPNQMPVDTTLDWANPGGLGGLAPVPVVAHLHGGDSAYLADGLPDAWSTPGDAYVGRLFSRPYTYDNTQESGHLWYHDHALGITRTNVYMGLAGMYFIRDANENRLRSTGVLPSYPYEVPLMIQDRMFAADGSLFYPSDAGVPGLPVPTHLPEFFGDVILVNGKAWPKLNVERRKYRFRLLNGSDSRVYDLRITAPTGVATPPMLVIGNELGLLDNAVYPDLRGQVGVLSIAPGERYDIIIDFSAMPVGTRLTMTNSAAAPYPAGAPVQAGFTDRIMAFDVVTMDTRVANASVKLGTALRLLPLAKPVVAGVARRRIMLYEGTDRFGRLQTMLGTVDQVKNLQGTLTYKDPITETPAVGSTEIWEFYNTTVDAHPIHMHLVDFRVLDRQAFTGNLRAKKNTDGSAGAVLNPASINFTAGAVAAPAWESGRKDTVRAFPGEVTRVLVRFARRGEYVYHCHILSHEDHEMMRKYQVI